MIRLTVSYSLPPGSDETEFLAWRLGEHQDNNVSMPGVARTDFARITDCWPEQKPSYAFQTVVEWPDRASFEAGFYTEAVQEKLKKDLQRLGDYVFTISETLS